jgi:hypothetical protein
MVVANDRGWFSWFTWACDRALDLLQLAAILVVDCGCNEWLCWSRGVFHHDDLAETLV